MHGGITRPPKPVDAKAQKLFDLVKACGAELGQTDRWQASGGVCDGNNIAACGVPVVDTMGVRGGAIHSPHEYHDRPLAGRACRPFRPRSPSACYRSIVVSFRLRAARSADLEPLYEMAKLTGGGFTNLPPDRKSLSEQAGTR